MKFVPSKSYLCVKYRVCSQLTPFDDSGEPLPAMSPVQPKRRSSASNSRATGAALREPGTATRLSR